MEEGTIPPRSNRKRPFLEDLEDDDSNKPPKPKKVKFPKGKKVKTGEEAAAVAITPTVEDAATDIRDPRLAARERAKCRNQITAELFSEETNDGAAAEVTYEDNENFVEDGIQIEPFNLDKEREEGYFDAEGNFVEYVNEKELKDAWLDSVEVDPRYAGKSSTVTSNEDDDKNDLSSEDIGIIKRRIANSLEPGETVLQALRRLKGNSNKRKEKMSAETQILFDQLTEDANELLDQGEYNVYHDKQEVFQREAEGYEKLALARGKGTSQSASQEISDYSTGKDLPSLTDLGATSSIMSNSDVGSSNINVPAAEISSNGADMYDMFGDDDDTGIAEPSSNNSNLVSVPNSKGFGQPSSYQQTSASETGASEDDYVYDETSGYYYSSSTGYYYDPSTGLYCYATSGKWYSFNEETGTYDEIPEVAPIAN